MKTTKRSLTKQAPAGRKSILAFIIPFIVAPIISSCVYDLKVLFYDPEKACKGVTLFSPYFTGLLYLADMEGRILTEYQIPFEDARIDAEFEVAEDGSLLVMGLDRIYQIGSTNTIDKIIPAPKCHHSFVQMPNGHLMYIYQYQLDVEGWDAPFLADSIREIDPETDEVIWEWKTGDHLSTDDYCPHHVIEGEPHTHLGGYDWTHSNSIVYRASESAVYLNSRHLDRIVKIDYPSGEILWSMGNGGDFGEGLFSHGHDPEFLPNGNILLYDNGNHRIPVEYSRAVEIAFDADQGWAVDVWQWPPQPWFYDYSMGDANRLPNGNTLITSPHHGSIFEVTRDHKIVWELYLDNLSLPLLQPLLYKAERFPYSIN